MFVDFQELKARVSFAQVIALVNVPMQKSGNQWRGACPACKKGGDRALVVTEGKGFFCFGTHKGGDIIAFVAHVRDISVKDAAQLIAQGVGMTSQPATTQEEKPEDGKSLAPLTYLEYEHDAVVAIGFDVEIAKQLGIGYAPKGIMRGTVAVPIRDENGVLRGYIGIEDAKLPPNFMTNVVSLDKRRA